MQFGLFDRTYDCLVEVSANQGHLMTLIWQDSIREVLRRSS